MHGFVHRLSGDNAWSLKLDSLSHFRLDGAQTIDGVSERIHDSAQHAFSDGDIHDGTSSFDDITFLNFSIRKLIFEMGNIRFHI